MKATNLTVAFLLVVLFAPSSKAINIQTNIGVSTAHNDKGASASDAFSQGLSIGTLNPDGSYQNWLSEMQTDANSYDTGNGAPLTHANTGITSNGPYMKGSVDAGFNGGHGNVITQSNSDTTIISPFGPGGPAILDNIKPLNETQKPSNTLDTLVDKIEISVNKTMDEQSKLYFAPRKDLEPKNA